MTSHPAGSNKIGFTLRSDTMEFFTELVDAFNRPTSDGVPTMTYHRMIHHVLKFVSENRDKFGKFMSDHENFRYEWIPEAFLSEQEEAKELMRENQTFAIGASGPVRFQDLPPYIIKAQLEEKKARGIIKMYADSKVMRDKNFVVPESDVEWAKKFLDALGYEVTFEGKIVDKGARRGGKVA
nr:hypothetical protein [uncultured Nitrososphaera sp.]